MLNISLSSEAAVRLQEILADEENDEACFRIRETKIGSG